METLQSQFLITRNETNQSHVMEYGDLVCYFFLLLLFKLYTLFTFIMLIAGQVVRVSSI